MDRRSGDRCLNDVGNRTGCFETSDDPRHRYTSELRNLSSVVEWISQSTRMYALSEGCDCSKRLSHAFAKRIHR
jgi:hypothetical protein